MREEAGRRRGWDEKGGRRVDGAGMREEGRGRGSKEEGAGR